MNIILDKSETCLKRNIYDVLLRDSAVERFSCITYYIANRTEKKYYAKYTNILMCVCAYDLRSIIPIIQLAFTEVIGDGMIG